MLSNSPVSRDQRHGSGSRTSSAPVVRLFQVLEDDENR
jgi:hypothetical protein